MHTRIMWATEWPSNSGYSSTWPFAFSTNSCSSALPWTISTLLTWSQSNSPWSFLIFSFPLRSCAKYVFSVTFPNKTVYLFRNDVCWVIIHATLSVHLTSPEFIILEDWILEVWRKEAMWYASRVESRCSGFRRLTIIRCNFNVPMFSGWFRRIDMGSCGWRIRSRTLLLSCGSPSRQLMAVMLCGVRLEF